MKTAKTAFTTTISQPKAKKSGLINAEIFFKKRGAIFTNSWSLCVGFICLCILWWS